MRAIAVNTWVVLTVIFAVCGGCKQGNPKKFSHTTDRMVCPDSLSVPTFDRDQDNNEEDSDYFCVPRHWKGLDDAVFLSSVPSPETIETWKSEFETVNPADSVWRIDMTRFKDADQYLAVTDFLELWHSVGKDIDVPQTEWRLLQWNPDSTAIPDGGFAKVSNLRTLFEALMCYETGSQLDMTHYSWLWTDFLSFYIRVLRKEIDCRVGRSVLHELDRETVIREHFHRKESAAFQIIQGDSLGGGSCFPYRVGMFGKECLEAEADTDEIFLFSLMENGSLMKVAKGIEPEDVLREYQHFASIFKDEEYCYSALEKKRVLSEEQKVWQEWINQRNRVSSLLSGNAKDAFDAATRILCREKLVLLKNRYYVKEAFCSEQIASCLASKDWPDKLIKEHDLEQLLSNSTYKAL